LESAALQHVKTLSNSKTPGKRILSRRTARVAGHHFRVLVGLIWCCVNAVRQQNLVFI
jgi:hypothetical protein